MTTMSYGDVPFLDPDTGRFPDSFAPPSVAIDKATAAQAALDAATAKGLAEGARDTLLAARGAANGVAPLDSGSRVPDANLPARLAASSLSATYVGPGVSVEVAADEAAIRAAAVRLSAAGGGTIMLPGSRITLTSPLPMLPGVRYKGQEPQILYANYANGTWIPDGPYTFGRGTVFQGNGTFACFEANATDQGSVAAQWGTTAIANAGIEGVGIDDSFTYGIHVGATNIMGLTYSRIARVWVRGVSQWGIKLVNFQHTEIESVHTSGCVAGGQFYGAQLPGVTLLPGNSPIGELFHLVPYANRYARGIVFEATGTNETLNELVIQRVQVNAFGRALLAHTVGVTSGSADVTVPDGTLYRVGMPVQFTTTANGFTAKWTYIVASVTGNVLTLATNRTDGPVSATGTGSMTLNSSGFPNVEVVGINTARVANVRILQIDIEGVNSVGLYAERCLSAVFAFADLPQEPAPTVVARNTGGRFSSSNAATLDFDGNSAPCEFTGQVAAWLNYQLRGSWLDKAASTYAWAVAPGLAGTVGVQIRQAFAYPLTAVGEHVMAIDGGWSLDGSHGGDIIFKHSSPTTMTLPTITAATPVASSRLGLWYEFVNVGSATLTVSTSGGQLFNKVGGRTSLTVAPQQSMRVVAVADTGGNLFWFAKPATALA